jgi:hypothetical protein
VRVVAVCWPTPKIAPMVRFACEASHFSFLFLVLPAIASDRAARSTVQCEELFSFVASFGRHSGQ